MIIDFHTHIFPPAVREKREAYFTGEPDFKLLYDAPKAKLAGARELIAVMDAEGVDKSVVFGFPWKNSETLIRHNDYIAEAIDMYPGRLEGFCCLDPLGKGAAAEAERCLSGKFAGVGELAFYRSGFDDVSIEHLVPVMEICRRSDVPVLIHANKPIGPGYPGKAPMTFRQIYNLITKFPDNTIVLAHWGGGFFFFHLVKKEMKQHLNNIYFDTAASPFLYDPEVYSIAVQIVGPEKILFGSDYPLIRPSRYFSEIQTAGLSPEAIERILGRNAAGLLKIETGA